VAKFQGDRSRELGERVAKQKKEEDTSAVKHKPVRNGGSGRPNNTAVVNVNNKNSIGGKITQLHYICFSANL